MQGWFQAYFKIFKHFSLWLMLFALECCGFFPEGMVVSSLHYSSITSIDTASRQVSKV